MKRYFFDLTDGARLVDNVGMEFASLAEARAQAIVIMAGAVMPDNPAMKALGEHWLIEVRGETGTVLFELSYRSRAEQV